MLKSFLDFFAYSIMLSSSAVYW